MMKKKQNQDHSIDAILSEILDEFESYDVVESREFHDSYEEFFLFSSSNKELLIDAIVRWIDGREFKLLDDEDFIKFEIFSKTSTDPIVKRIIMIGTEEDFLKS